MHDIGGGLEGARVRVMHDIGGGLEGARVRVMHRRRAGARERGRDALASA
jgi:hypothetical protein